MRRWCAIGLAALVVASCSVPTDEQASAIDPASLNSSSNPKKNCTSPGVDQPNPVVVHVYLVKQQGEVRVVAPVERIVAEQTATPLAALTALVDCRITDEDRRNGFASAVPDDVDLLGLDPIAEEPGGLMVRLGSLGARGTANPDDLDKIAVAQIFFTLTDPKLVEPARSIRFTVAGRPVAVNTDRRTAGQNSSVTSDDFVASRPSTATVSPTTSPTTSAPRTATTAARSTSTTRP